VQELEIRPLLKKLVGAAMHEKQQSCW